MLLDSDVDSLVYSFCSGFNGGSTSNASPVPPGAPPYGFIEYINGFSGAKPGNLATINPATGIISGIAPNPENMLFLFVSVLTETEFIFQNTGKILSLQLHHAILVVPSYFQVT